MTDFQQKNGYSVKPSQITEVKKIKAGKIESTEEEKLNEELSETYNRLKKSLKKIQEKIEEMGSDEQISINSLICRTYDEYLLVKSLRQKKSSNELEHAKILAKHVRKLF